MANLNIPILVTCIEAYDEGGDPSGIFDSICSIDQATGEEVDSLLDAIRKLRIPSEDPQKSAFEQALVHLGRLKERSDGSS